VKKLVDEGFDVPANSSEKNRIATLVARAYKADVPFA
jgi:hypothetical protein